MKYFTIKELTKSTKAESLGIDNTPNDSQTAALTYLVDYVLDPIRAKWGGPITVNSGFRSEKLNEAIKGSASSQHLCNNGAAADITVGSNEENEKLYKMIQDMPDLVFDQLIDEYGYSWIHISYKHNRRMIFKIE